MATLESATGFVLRTWPLRESDLIVSLFTREHGKVRGVARGATKPKSRWAGALDAMTEVTVGWRAREGDELVTLTDCAIVRSPYRSVQELAVTWTLAYVAELVDATASAHDADETSYRLVRASVDALLAGVPPPVVARYVESWTLRLHGVLPETDACVGCGRALAEDGGTWHWSLHGLACPRCVGREVGGVTLLPDDLAWLDELRRRAPAAVPAPDPRVMRRVTVFLRQLLLEFLGKPLKSERFLEM